jgi:hypothetical protein
MALRPIVETCVPRMDVLAGGLTDAHFAAQLDQVVRAPGKYPVYGDPSQFFAVTYPTAGLRELLTSTFGRLSGKAGHIPGAEHGVVRFQTSFGGGKTHGLIAAYYLASGQRPLVVDEFVDPALLPADCAVAAVAGDALDALSGHQVAGQKVLTMWGAIAAQLGAQAWKAMAAHDTSRSAPGKDVWVSIFEARPTLVIIDEVAAHLRALTSAGDPDVRRQGEAMPAFLFNLFSAAAEVATARVVITLATARDAFGVETAGVEKLLDQASPAGREAKSVIDRFREILVPAQAEEISEILRRRLFEHIDEKAAEEAGKTFHEYYGSLEKREVRLGWEAGIRDAVRRSYPLHPELVRVLDARVGTIPEFQRTRGALRLLAETVASLWARRSRSVCINLADLPLDAEPVGSALTRSIDREAFAPVLAADVAGPASHAGDIDRTRFAGATPFASRAAAAVFLHSLEHTAATGATLVDVYRGTLTPGDDPDLVEEALRLLDLAAWHFSYDGSRYRFQTEPNPRKIVEDEKAGVALSTVREELDHRIGVMFASAGPVKTRLFASSPADLEDRAELRMAVIHYEDLTVNARTASPTPLQLADMLDTCGASKANRTYRNSIVFLVADTDQVDAMRQVVRYHLAAKRIVDDGDRMRTYAEEVQRKLREINQKAGLDARVAITRCYRHLYYPKGDRANHHLRHHELSHQAQGEQDKNQTAVIQGVLEGIGKIRTAPIATDFLASVAGFPQTDPIATAQAAEGFWRNHDADLVLNPTIITDAMAAGIRNGAWVYYDADAQKAYTADSPPPSPKVAAATWLYTHAKAQEAGILKRDPTWDDIRKELERAGGQLTGTDLRSRLEAALGQEPSKGAIVDVLTRVLRQAEPPAVVVEGEPTAESKALAPSTVERVALDRVVVLTRARAQELGIGPTVVRGGFQVTESGAPGPVFGTLADRLTELGPEKRIDHIEVGLTVTGTGTSAIRTLLSAIPMLPKMTFTVSLMGSGSFPGLAGEVTVPNLSGPTADFRKIDKLILDLWDKATELTADLTLIHTPAEPIDPAGDAWKSLRDTLVSLKAGSLTVKVRGR